jgi:hypothetical protein
LRAGRHHPNPGLDKEVYAPILRAYACKSRMAVIANGHGEGGRK